LATVELYPLSLHDALPIWFFCALLPGGEDGDAGAQLEVAGRGGDGADAGAPPAAVVRARARGGNPLRAAGPEAEVPPAGAGGFRDRKSTRLNSSHVKISYA